MLHPNYTAGGRLFQHVGTVYEPAGNGHGRFVELPNGQAARDGAVAEAAAVSVLEARLFPLARIFTVAVQLDAVGFQLWAVTDARELVDVLPARLFVANRMRRPKAKGAMIGTVRTTDAAAAAHAVAGQFAIPVAAVESAAEAGGYSLFTDADVDGPTLTRVGEFVQRNFKRPQSDPEPPKGEDLPVTEELPK